MSLISGMAKCPSRRYELIVFPNYRDLWSWRQTHTSEILCNDGHILRVVNRIEFPNGNILVLYDKSNGILPLLGSNFSRIRGTKDPEFLLLERQL